MCAFLLYGRKKVVETLETGLKKVQQMRMVDTFIHVSTSTILVETKWKQVETKKRRITK